MKSQPANQNKSDLEDDSFQKNFLIHQRKIRKYILHLHLDQMGYIRKKFNDIEESLQQEAKKSLENQLHLLQKKRLLQKLKAFFSSRVSQFHRALKIKKHRFWKILFLQFSSLKFSLGYEELISLFVLLGLISIIVVGTLLNPSGPQFLMTFY